MKAELRRLRSLAPHQGAALLKPNLREAEALFEAAVIANAAAGIVVGKVGAATASASEVQGSLPAALAAARGEAP